MGSTMTLCQSRVPFQPWCRIFHTSKTWGTRTSNPIRACQHSASDQSIPPHHLLQAAVIPYLLQRPPLYSQGRFPRASDPEMWESPNFPHTLMLHVFTASNVIFAAPGNKSIFPSSVLSQSTDSQHRSEEYLSVHVTGTRWVHDMHQHKGPRGTSRSTTDQSPVKASSGPGSGQQ